MAEWNEQARGSGMKDETQGRARGWIQNLRMFVTGGVMLAGSLFLLGTMKSADRLLSAVSELWRPSQSKPEVDVKSILIQQVKEASDLTTATFVMQAVVPTKQEASLNGLVIGTTKLLYIAYGEVKAGVDLQLLTTANIETVGDRVKVTLPPAKIMDSKIDVTRSSVYDYDRGFLGLGPDVAPSLQQQAQQEALSKLVAAACTDKILDRASDRAKLVVTQLFATAGVQNLMVEVQPAPTEACPTTGALPPQSVTDPSSATSPLPAGSAVSPVPVSPAPAVTPQAQQPVIQDTAPVPVPAAPPPSEVETDEGN